MNVFFKAISVLLISQLSFHTYASDLAKEQRWADQVVDAIIDGDAEWLNDGKHDFLSIYTEAEQDKKRAVIIMHGTGVHPDWQQVVQPLRVELTTHNWHTLSIQMPVLANEAEYPEYAPLYSEIAARIDAAISFLTQQGVQHIVLLGHSQGATMAAYYLRSHSHKVTAFAAIGMPGSFGTDVQNSIKSIAMAKVPMLDLYGSDDLEGVVNSSRERKQAGKHLRYSQKMVAGANHFFDNKDSELVDAVAQWLTTVK